MEDYIFFQSRKYAGKGSLKFNNSANLDCDFEFMFRNDGKITFEAVLYVTNDNCEIILNLIHPQKIPFASFDGNIIKNGRIKIDRMVLDGGDVNGSTLVLPNSDKHRINDDLLRKILSVLGAEQYIESYRNTVFTSRLRFLLMSKVIIDYENSPDTDIMTSVTAISNFQFGPSDENSNPILRNIETFDLSVDDIKITFERKSDYAELISQSVFNRNTDVTATASIDIKKSNADHAIEVLNKICILLSFSNGNWITPFYTDYLKKGDLVRTIFYKNKTYKFNNSRHLIDLNASPYTSIIDFISKSYKKYNALVKDFRIHKVIEYYISAHVNSIQQEKFCCWIYCARSFMQCSSIIC